MSGGCGLSLGACHLSWDVSKCSGLCACVTGEGTDLLSSRHNFEALILELSACSVACWLSFVDAIA